MDELVYATEYEANEVLKTLRSLIEQYESTTVGDYYELSGLSSSYTDSKVGWTELPEDVPIEKQDKVYIIKLPPPKELKW